MRGTAEVPRGTSGLCARKSNAHLTTAEATDSKRVVVSETAWWGRLRPGTRDLAAEERSRNSNFEQPQVIYPNDRRCLWTNTTEAGKQVRRDTADQSIRYSSSFDSAEENTHLHGK